VGQTEISGLQTRIGWTYVTCIPRVATKIGTGRRTKKIKFVKTEFGVGYYRKLWKTIKKKARSAKNQNFGPGVGYAWGRY